MPSARCRAGDDAYAAYAVFMIAATWPDPIKRDASCTSGGSHGVDRPDGSPNPSGNHGHVGPGPFTLTAAYQNAAKAVARQRVALAGARLARSLNKELK